MDVQHLVELGLGGIGEGGVQAGASVVNQKIELVGAEGVRQGGRYLAVERREAGHVGGIERQGHRFAAQNLYFGHYRVGLGLLAVVGEDNVNTFFGQAQGHVAAQAAAATGYEGYFGGAHQGNGLG